MSWEEILRIIVAGVSMQLHQPLDDSEWRLKIGSTFPTISINTKPLHACLSHRPRIDAFTHNPHACYRLRKKKYVQTVLGYLRDVIFGYDEISKAFPLKDELTKACWNFILLLLFFGWFTDLLPQW